jgi:hypothetical protein
MKVAVMAVCTARSSSTGWTTSWCSIHMAVDRVDRADPIARPGKRLGERGDRIELSERAWRCWARCRLLIRCTGVLKRAIQQQQLRSRWPRAIPRVRYHSGDTVRVEEGGKRCSRAARTG